MGEPLISIITVCRNSADFVTSCLESVACQHYPALEHVVIDGASTDGTVDIIKRHEKALSYWHSRPDAGIGNAFNLGVENSRGDWLLFLNADDYLCRPDALRILAENAASKPADVVYAQVQPVTREPSPRAVGAAVGWPYAPWRFLLKDLIPHPAALTRRAHLERVGPFREDLRIAVDYELYLRSYRNLRAVFVPRILTHMRVGGRSSASSLALEEMFRAHALHQVLAPAPRALLRTFIRAKVRTGRILRDVRPQTHGTPRDGSAHR